MNFNDPMDSFHYHSGVFEVLLFVYDQTSPRRLEMEKYFLKCLKESEMINLDNSQNGDLINILLRSDLIHLTHSNRHIKNIRYSLTPLGIEIIANALVAEKLSLIEDSPRALLEYEDKIQCLIVSQLSKSALIELSESFDEQHAPGSDTIKVFYERMKYLGLDDSARDILKVWSMKHPSFWVREQSVSCLGRLQEDDSIRQFLTSVAESDPSCRVQNKAFEILLNYESR